MIYPAKCDWWIAGLAEMTLLLPIGLGVLAAYQMAIQAMPPIPGVLGMVLSLGIAGLWLWMFLGTSYEIGETELVNRLGPFCLRVPLNAIEEIVSTTGFCLVIGRGMAWSLDMLHVKYRKANGRRAWPVSISPRDKTGFLQELATAIEGLKIVGDDVGQH